MDFNEIVDLPEETLERLGSMSLVINDIINKYTPEERMMIVGMITDSVAADLDESVAETYCRLICIALPIEDEMGKFVR